MKQYVDGENMETVKDTFSIRSSELDLARALLDSMAKELAASVVGGRQLITPDGNLTYMSRPKEINLQLPPARKKQKPPAMPPSSPS